MRAKSPQRTRRIRNSAIIGAVVGVALGIFGLKEFGTYIYFVFVIFGALIAGLTAAYTITDYDYD